MTILMEMSPLSRSGIGLKANLRGISSARIVAAVAMLHTCSYGDKGTKHPSGESGVWHAGRTHGPTSGIVRVEFAGTNVRSTPLTQRFMTNLGKAGKDKPSNRLLHSHPRGDNHDVDRWMYRKVICISDVEMLIVNLQKPMLALRALRERTAMRKKAWRKRDMEKFVVPMVLPHRSLALCHVPVRMCRKAFVPKMTKGNMNMTNLPKMNILGMLNSVRFHVLLFRCRQNKFENKMLNWASIHRGIEMLTLRTSI